MPFPLIFSQTCKLAIMLAKFSRAIFLGIASALIGGVLCLILAYGAGVVVIAISLRELPATVLAAVTVLPLMLIFIGIPVTSILGLMTGLLLGLGAALRGRPFGFLVGALLGIVCAEVVLSLLLPLVAPPQRDDFIHIVSSPYLSASYGVVLGVITSRLLAWMDGGRK